MIAYVDGRFVDASAASISVFDRGLLHGDSVFATLRGEDGRAVFLDDHRKRLVAAAARHEIPFDRGGELAAILERLLAENAPKDAARLRITITRGPGDLLAPARPTWIVTAHPLEVQAALYRTGVAAAILESSVEPWIDDVPAKTGSWMGHARARRWAAARSAHEAIRLDARGNVLEGSSSTVFWRRGSRLETPSLALGLLPGVTREKLLGIAASDSAIGAVHEVEAGADALREASEVFLANSLIEVLPVTRIDDRVVGDGAPGALSIRLRDALRATYIQDQGEIR